MAEMSFAEHNNMVETLPSDRTDERMVKKLKQPKEWRP
jgi:hypothetical protein